jgi:hypothetical protein
MLQENEVAMLLLGVIVLLFILVNISQIRRIFAWKMLVYSYSFLLTGWLLTILEGYFLESFLNFLEHFCYLVSAVILTFWCIRALRYNQPEGLP